MRRATIPRNHIWPKGLILECAEKRTFRATGSVSLAAPGSPRIPGANSPAGDLILAQPSTRTLSSFSTSSASLVQMTIQGSLIVNYGTHDRVMCHREQLRCVSPVILTGWPTQHLAQSTVCPAQILGFEVLRCPACAPSSFLDHILRPIPRLLTRVMWGHDTS